MPFKPNNFFGMVKTIVKNFNLSARQVTPEEGRIAIMKGRQCLCYFYLLKEEFQKFIQFYKNNPKGILTKNILKIKKNNNGENKPMGHVIVLMSIEENCIKFLNSYGENWGDKGYFRIKDEKVLRGLDKCLVEIYWEKSDLTEDEINKYNYNFSSFIQEASKYLSQPNLNIKNDLQKEFECQKCQKKYKLNNFKLILYQAHRRNDETDTRNLKIGCLVCGTQFELNKFEKSDSIIATLLYINYILK